MWGSDQQFQDLTPGVSLSKQVGRVDYGRPETWTFLLSLKVTNGNAPAPVAGTVDCAFDLFLGSGRSTIEVRNFVAFQVNIPNLTNAAVGPLLWATTAQSPQRTFPPAGNEFTIANFPAQSINAQARVLFTCVDPLATVSLVASGFFAPRTHIRPEWFKGGEFKGGENDGM
jgi:hypothetical protein